MKITDLPEFSHAEYLKNEDDIAAYLTSILKALHSNAHPRFDTVSKFCHALSVKISVTPISQQTVTT